MISIYCGLFFISDINVTNETPGTYHEGVNIQERTRVFFFVLIVLANALFLLYWLAMIVV